MSYDLSFVPSAEGAPLTTEYFRDRAYYSVEGGQAVYQHPDSGVYFIFEDVAEGGDCDPPATLQLILNLYRPHFFALEAADEIEALVAATGAQIHDPQDAETAVRPFDARRFIAAWNDSNAKGCRALLAPTAGEPLPVPFTRPNAELEAIWRWNRSRSERAERVDDDVFIPRVSFLTVGADVWTVVVWTDAMPAVLPEVDGVLVYRDSIKKARWAIWKKAADVALVSWADLIARLPAGGLDAGAPRTRNLAGFRPSGEFVDYLRALPAIAADMKLIPADQVLNRELVAPVAG